MNIARKIDDLCVCGRPHPCDLHGEDAIRASQAGGGKQLSLFVREVLQ